MDEFLISLKAKTTIFEPSDPINIRAGKIVLLEEKLSGDASRFLRRIFYGDPNSDASLSINGKRIVPHKQRADRIVAYLPNHNITMPDITVADNIQMWYPDPADQDPILYEPLMQPIIQTKTGNLSGGERRFLEFLLMIHLPHLLLLLDTPFSSMAPLLLERCNELLKEKCSNRGIVISGHKFHNSINVQPFKVVKIISLV